MDREEKLEDHVGKGVNGRYKCGVKHAMEMVRMAESGESKHICQVCGKGFKEKSGLLRHSTAHSKEKLFHCDVDGCDKTYTRHSKMVQHKKVAHEGVYHECEECGRRFGQKSDMMKHYKTVHLEEKHYKYSKCGVQFAQKR
jgi:KRAB domain-containing zinc finger protein